MKIRVIIVLIICLVLVGCESKIPLFLAYKDNNEYTDISLNDIKKFQDIAHDYNEEDIMQGVQSEYCKFDENKKERYKKIACEFLETRFCLSYTKNSSEKFANIIEEQVLENVNQFFVNLFNDLEDTKTVMIVKTAQIMPGNIEKEYIADDNERVYGIYCQIILYSSSIDERFFERNPYINKPSTLIGVWLYVRDKDSLIIGWSEDYSDQGILYFKGNARKSETSITNTE